jgi:hypothetical protein
MPGFGPILGAQLLVAAGDLRAYPSAGHLAAAAGLVPVPNDSGRRSGNLHKPRRYSRPLRHVFYLCPRRCKRRSSCSPPARRRRTPGFPLEPARPRSAPTVRRRYRPPTPPGQPDRTPSPARPRCRLRHWPPSPTPVPDRRHRQHTSNGGFCRCLSQPKRSFESSRTPPIVEGANFVQADPAEHPTDASVTSDQAHISISSQGVPRRSGGHSQ